MRVTVSGQAKPAIDYTLNLLGIRVWEKSCVLIAKSGRDWRPLGPPRSLPLPLPAKPDDLTPPDELALTAFQLHVECPQLGVIDVLTQRKPFSAALEDCMSCAIS